MCVRAFACVVFVSGYPGLIKANDAGPPQPLASVPAPCN